MIQRKTQTEAYWKEEFDITDQDTTGVYDLVLEEGEPVPMEALVVWLMERHCRLEEAVIQTELSKGPAYQPAEQYEVGQQLIFPAFEYTLGTVVGERKAISPEYGEFTAIKVQFEGKDGTREFASGLSGEHKLNRANGEVGLLASKDLTIATTIGAETIRIHPLAPVKNSPRSQLVDQGDIEPLEVFERSSFITTTNTSAETVIG